jgi:hypothetical protein
MAINITCECGKQFLAKDEYAGKRAVCPSCRRELVLPLPEAPAHVKPSDPPSRDVAPSTQTTNAKPSPPPLSASRRHENGVGPIGAREGRAPMKIPAKWRDAARFTIGVLCVWGAVSFISSVVQSITRDNRNLQGRRLRESELCYVQDFMAQDFYAPTECWVADREYQLHPGSDGKVLEHLFSNKVDYKTLVMVDADSGELSIRKGEPGKRADVDEHYVFVHFISGPLTGRYGWIARYKLSPLNRVD